MQLIKKINHSKNLPVIAQVPYTNVSSYVNDKLLVPFDEDMFDGKHRLSTNDFNDIYPEFLKNTKYDNKYYSIPFSKSVQILYYNKHLLNKYHLSVPHDWHDFQKMRHKLPHNVVLVSCNKSLAPEYNALSKQPAHIQ